MNRCPLLPGLPRRRRFRIAPIAAVLMLALCLIPACADASPPQLERAPGTVIAHHPAPSRVDRIARRAVYTASPSIVVMPDGDYIVTYNIFGAGSGADRSGTTHVYRSRDAGETWHHVTTLTDMKRGSLFVHGGALYLWGYRAAPGDIIIRRSTDAGRTWTTPDDERTGLLRRGHHGGTPHNPVIHNGRIWFAQGTRVMSARADADLLHADVWTRSSAADLRSGPLGGNELVITEGQIVASPDQGVVLMPKVGGLPNTVLLRVGDTPGTLLDPRDDDWVHLPGGEKKFAAAYDAVSKRFYVLSSIVLPAFADRPEPPELIRNTAALLYSHDLRQWHVADIFLHSPNPDYEGFQYFNFDIDGDDMVIVSRTAFDVGTANRPPRGHDSNLITFHRLKNFRQLTTTPTPLNQVRPWER